jgi:hypothetical protein
MDITPLCLRGEASLSLAKIANYISLVHRHSFGIRWVELMADSRSTKAIIY